MQAQEILNNFIFPESMKMIELRNKELEGDLIIDLNKFKKLEIIILSRNKLTSINFLGDSNELKHIDVSNNDIQPTSLEMFSRFPNLTHLRLGSYDKDNIENGIYNRFFGSLKPLEKLSQLEKLDIRNTDIDSGLEYLPDKLVNFSEMGGEILYKAFDCYFTRPEAKMESIFNQLTPFQTRLGNGNEDGPFHYNLKA